MNAEKWALCPCGNFGRLFFFLFQPVQTLIPSFVDFHLYFIDVPLVPPLVKVIVRYTAPMFFLFLFIV